MNRFGFVLGIFLLGGGWFICTAQPRQLPQKFLASNSQALSARGGKAKITLDGGTPEVIDTYSADEIWGVLHLSPYTARGHRHTHPARRGTCRA